MSKVTKNDPESSGSLKRELGLAAATAIVIGNMIGSGIFMSPQSMADSSNPKTIMLAWVITAIGSILIALSFAKLGRVLPKTGGPIVYTRAAFGDFAAFLIAWSYWIGAWVGNAAIITAFMNYFTHFVPGVSTPIVAFLVSSAILWLFTIINILGVKEAGVIGVVTTVLKIVPLVIFVIIALMKFDAANFNTIANPDNAGLGTLPAAIAVALWAFVGLESATIPAGEIKNPEKNIVKSTIYGTILTALIYVIISFAAMGAMPQDTLAASSAPLADIINYVTGGTWGGNFIALGAVVSTLGATSGWILTTARSAFAGGEDKLFPAVFSKVHPRFKTPYAALIISGIAANALLIMNYVSTLTKAYNFMLLLATLSFLPAYSFTAAAEIVLLFKDKSKFNLWVFLKNSFIALLAFAYSIYAIYGTGKDVVMYGFILILIGIPFYVYMMLQNNKKDGSVEKLRKEAGLK